MANMLNNSNIQIGGGRRSSNLELYRIFCMLSIVAHHFVVNSGLIGGPIQDNPQSANTLFLLLFGMWGKTGINCFLMITGYFMCKSTISIKKFVKLLLWIYIYKIIIFGIFFITGHESITSVRLVKLIMPVWGFNSNFTSCFLAFWLTIPFWNILIQNMTQKQHIALTTLMLSCYTLLSSVPSFDVTFNYVTWFGIIYLIASYIRLYPANLFEHKNLWMCISIISILIAVASVVAVHYRYSSPGYMFVSDSNKIFAVAVAVSTFLWFKNINLPYSRIINVVGGTTFGVLLIHANSDAMRQWLWKDTVDCVGHYNLPLAQLILFSFATVIVVFCVCSAIDRIRQLLIEKPFFRWYDKHNISDKLSEKFSAFLKIEK